jgi:hypothetical protein
MRRCWLLVTLLGLGALLAGVTGAWFRGGTGKRCGTDDAAQQATADTSHRVPVDLFPSGDQSAPTANKLTPTASHSPAQRVDSAALPSGLPWSVVRDPSCAPTSRNNAANRLLNERDPKLAGELIRMLKDEAERASGELYAAYAAKAAAKGGADGGSYFAKEHARLERMLFRGDFCASHRAALLP